MVDVVLNVLCMHGEDVTDGGSDDLEKITKVKAVI
jgi:hypothetical protein